MSSIPLFDPMDASDGESFGVKWADLLGPTDTIASITSVSLDAAALAAGVTVANGGITADPDTARPSLATKFSLDVQPANENDAAFDGDGLTARVTTTIVSTVGRTLSRSVEVPIEQL